LVIVKLERKSSDAEEFEMIGFLGVSSVAGAGLESCIVAKGIF
jgi:hypothetical protein